MTKSGYAFLLIYDTAYVERTRKVGKASMSKKSWWNIIKGAIVGGTMLVPGVSGGTMAILLNIYDDLISAVSSFFSHKAKNAWFLGTFVFGAGLGIVLFAQPMLFLTERFHMPLLYFFCGAILGSIPMLYGKAGLSHFSWSTLGYPIAGAALVCLLSFLPADLLALQEPFGFNEYLLLLIAGIIAAVALILPGISVSYMFLVLGAYDATLKAVSQWYWPYLVPLAVGLLLGIILTTKILEKAMLRHPQGTYLIILGFVLASLVEVFPGFVWGGEIFICFILLGAGFFLVWRLSRLRNT